MLNANDPLAIALKNAELMAQRRAKLNDLLAVIEYRQAKLTKSIQENAELLNQINKGLEKVA